MKTVMIFAVVFPVIMGLLLILRKNDSLKVQNGLFLSALFAETLLIAVLLIAEDCSYPVLTMTEDLRLILRVDGISRIFLSISAISFLLSGIFALRYMQHSERQGSFYAFMLFSLGALCGVDLSDNLITMYLFFEMATLLSMPLVLHDRTEASIRAALKYLFYSVAGAFLALFCIFILSGYCTSLTFTPGGTLDPARVAGHEKLLLTALFLGVVGFGAKAGMYPLHGWLPEAHPVAPAPASAVLSSVITKAGVLSILRMVYYIAGPGFLRGTWVQKWLLALALLTVFMGSMMAYREKIFKKRLAYSSVSQISYILFGLFVMTEEAVSGGLLHVLFHATIKTCLFLVAGSFIVNTGKTCVDDFRGFGKSMPVTLWCFTIASLGLIGIPPFAGFVSKWYLAAGSLSSEIPVYSWLGPVILLVSALLTAGYLLPVTIHGFFPGKDFVSPGRSDEGGAEMKIPLLILAALTLFFGVFGGRLYDAVSLIAQRIAG